METAGSPKFPGNPRDLSPCSPTPVGPGRLSRPWVSCLARPPRLTRTRAQHEEISGLNRTAFDLAAYASQGWSPTHHPRLASGCWSGSTGRDWLPAGFHLKGFNLRLSSSPELLGAKSDRVFRRPAARKSPKDRSVSSDR